MTGVASTIPCRGLHAAIGSKRKAQAAAQTERPGQDGNAAIRFESKRSPALDGWRDTRGRHAPLKTAPRLQRGVYALEWAIIFPVFFMLLYAIISYGLAFLVRESMQFAAEDGARAALRYQPDRTARLDAAKAVVINHLGWLPDALRPTTDAISVNICHVGNAASCSPSLTCGTTIAERCMVQLDFSIPYGSAPLVPGLSLLDMDILNPATLSASASILVDRGGL